jgi:hypothetical protein
MPADPPTIKGSEKIISVFGYWPSFHDAEILEVSLHRKFVGTGSPALTARVHVFEMTNEVSNGGYFVCRYHSIVTLRFYAIADLVLENFNHQNALSGLDIEEIASGGFSVSFDEAFGMDSSFNCQAIELVDLEPGIPFGSVHVPKA